MPKPQIAMNAQDFRARLETLGPTDKIVAIDAQTTRAVWVRKRDGKEETISLSFSMPVDRAHRILAEMAARENPKPSIDQS